jgi:hypothetical protein
LFPAFKLRAYKIILKHKGEVQAARQATLGKLAFEVTKYLVIAALSVAGTLLVKEGCSTTNPPANNQPTATTLPASKP